MNTTEEERREITAMSDAQLEAYILSELGTRAGWQFAAQERSRRQLVKLTKPHWTLVPIFFLTCGSILIGLVALLIALEAWLHPKPPDAPASSASPPPLSAPAAPPIGSSPSPQPSVTAPRVTATPTAP